MREEIGEAKEIELRGEAGNIMKYVHKAMSRNISEVSKNRHRSIL